jgi:hypothetical protein
MEGRAHEDEAATAADDAAAEAAESGEGRLFDALAADTRGGSGVDRVRAKMVGCEGGLASSAMVAQGRSVR